MPLITQQTQITADFMVRSVEDLEHIANPRKPPLDLKTLTEISDAFNEPHDRAKLDEQLTDMDIAFRGRGDPLSWPDDVLTQIDQCFVEHFYASGKPRACLFYPFDKDYMDSFSDYCEGVDKILREDRSCPPFAQEYFVYSMLWKRRGQRFPVPLGTASAVGAVYILTKMYKRGLTEVRSISYVVLAYSRATYGCVYVRGTQCAPRIPHTQYVVRIVCRISVCVYRRHTLCTAY